MIERLSYDLVKTLLKPPLYVLGFNAETVRPKRSHYEQSFVSLEQVYAFFRKERPEGRWLIWIQDADGQEMPLDSKRWESALNG